MNKVYTWKYTIGLPPYDKVIEVLEAFFASYPEGDYACEHREQYKLAFRRGAWKRSLLGLGDLVPETLAPGQFNRWPVYVKVMVRPSPVQFQIAAQYEVHLPKSVPSLSDPVQTSVDQHIRVELGHLAEYLAECAGLKEAPAVSVA